MIADSRNRRFRCQVQNLGIHECETEALITLWRRHSFISVAIFDEVIVVRVSVRLQEQILNVLFEKLALGRSPMCPGLSSGETTHDEWQRLNTLNDVVYQAFSHSHEERSRHKSGRISQPQYFNRENLCF
jgi:hypothetical protein